jgi:hypothetical protein
MPRAFEGFGAADVVGGPVSRHLVPEWVSGQGFFNTEAARGPRGATEKRVLSSGEAPSPDKAPQAILQTRRVEVEQQADRKTTHAQINL